MMVLNEDYKMEKNSQSKVEEEVKEKEKTEEESKHVEEKKADTATQALVYEIDKKMKVNNERINIRILKPASRPINHPLFLYYCIPLSHKFLCFFFFSFFRT